jgi:hypothetical protein
MKLSFWSDNNDAFSAMCCVVLRVCDLVFFFNVRSCWKSMSLCCDEGDDGLILLWERLSHSYMFLIALIVVVPFLLRVVFFFFFFGCRDCVLCNLLWILLCAVWCFALYSFLASNGRAWRQRFVR